MMLVELIGIGFFGYLIGKMNSLFVKIDTIGELKEEMEDTINFWLIKLNKSNNDRLLSLDFFNDTQRFFLNLWDKDYTSITTHIFYKELKPQLKRELIDQLF